MLLSEGDCKNVNAISFYSGSSSLLNSIKVQPKQSANEPTGYTICLRINCRSWYYQSLLLSDHTFLSIMNYTNGSGHFRNGVFNYTFDWKFILHLTTWNSLCFVYNYSASSLNISINGFNVFTALETIQQKGENHIFSKLDGYLRRSVSDISCTK